MKLKHEFVVREIAGETLLVPVGTATLSLNGMLVLNECGKYLWDRIPDAGSEEDLINALLAEYEVNRQTAAQDVAEFLESLRKLGII
ncbi:MAG: PqqD family protein [Oscillospiraceae bacterium]|nr:PqqD family protein [Oscillospiraceae bacterium]